MISPKIGGFIVAAFMAGAFIASPELRAYAANTVGSADIINNSIQSVDIKDGEVKAVDLGGSAVTSAKIKNGEVKSEDIATDAVGARELKGLDKLIFADCAIPTLAGAGLISSYACQVPGVDNDDEVIAMENAMANNVDCYTLEAADVVSVGVVMLHLKNTCDNFNPSRIASHVSIIVYDELPDKILPTLP